MEQTTTAQFGYQSPAVTRVRYCLYSRKSTESDEKQILSIDSQIKEMLQIAQKDNLEVVEIKKEAHSAKDSCQRPVFNQMINEIKEGKFNGILTWAPDRRSRNAGDLGSLVDLIDQKLLVEIKTYGQRFSNSPNEKFLLMILGSQAKLENDNKSINVKRGLRTRLEMGLWPSVAPTGYLNEKRTDRKGCVLIDPKRAPIIKQMFEKVACEQWSGRKLYQWLRHDVKFKTKNGIHLYLSNIYLILKNTFYYGAVEYPRGSGNWYAGKHTPLISKELFDQAQKQISIEQHIRHASKEFAFTKLIKCGLCDSGITAEEKFKKLKDGSTKRYIYYGCARSKDIHCKNGYIQEKELVNQLLGIIDEIKLEEIGIRHKLEQEVQRYNKFQHVILKAGKEEIRPGKNIDVKEYAKYILKEGNILEKRELLASLKSRLILTKKILTLEK